MAATGERAEVAMLVALARCELKEAEAALARGDDCSAALARAANRRDQAIFALVDGRAAASPRRSPQVTPPLPGEAGRPNGREAALRSDP
jgi:hypothetical protein